MDPAILPLKGVKVIDFTRILAGPFATLVLSDLGADIIKVEPPMGDDTRYWAPIVNGVSVYFLSINRNKKSIVINLKREEGREIVYKLIREADVVIENFREGVTERLGIDYETLNRINRRLIYCSIRGFRKGTKYESKGGADLIIQGMSGLMSATGEKESGPVKVPFALFDVYAGFVAATAIIAALRYRDSAGKGIYIEVPLFDSAIYCMVYLPLIYLMTGRNIPRMGSAHPSIVPYQAFKCRDGRYIVTGAFNDDMWRRFCEALGLEDLIDNKEFKTNISRVKNRERLIKILNERFLAKSSREWIEVLENKGVVVAPLYTFEDVFNDSYAVEAELAAKMHHTKLPEIHQILFPAVFDGVKPRPRRPPPEKGEATKEILKELGYDDNEIKRLIDNGIVY